MRKEREGVFHRNHELNLAQGQDHAGIATIPLHLEWKEAAPIPPPEFSTITCLSLGRKFMLIPKLLPEEGHRQRESSALVGFPHQPLWHGAIAALDGSMDLSHTHRHSPTPFRCNYIRNVFAKPHPKHLGAH